MFSPDDKVVVMGLPSQNFNVFWRAPSDFDQNMFIDLVMTTIQLSNQREEVYHQFGMLWDVVDCAEEPLHEEYVHFVVDAVMDTADDLWMQVHPVMNAMDATHPQGFYINDILIKPDGLYGIVTEN